MKDMEHMKMRWVPHYEHDEWNIITECAGDPWYVASIPRCLPGDTDGEATAKAICDAHNAYLTANKQAVGTGPAAGTGTHKPMVGGLNEHH